MKNYLLSTIIIAFFISVSLTGCIGEEPDLDIRYNLRESFCISQDVLCFVNGVIKNNEDHNVKVSIRAYFYDENNVLLGKDDRYSLCAKNNINQNIPPGYELDFTLVYDGNYVDDVDHVKFKIS